MSDFVDTVAADYAAMIHGEFSESFTVSTADKATTVTVSGIFEATFQEIDPDTQGVVLSTHPRAMIYKSDVSFSVVQGCWVTARSKTYRVRHPEPDGDGAEILYLD